MRLILPALAAVTIATGALAQPAARKATQADIVASLLNVPAGQTPAPLPSALIPFGTTTGTVADGGVVANLPALLQHNAAPLALDAITAPWPEALTGLYPQSYDLIPYAIPQAGISSVVLGRMSGIAITGPGSISSAGHGVGLLGYGVLNAPGSTVPLLIGAEGKMSLLAGTAVIGVAVEANLNQVAAGATLSNGWMVDANENLVSENMPLLSGLQVRMGTVAAGKTISFNSGVYMQPPTNVLGTISETAGLFFPDWTTACPSPHCTQLNAALVLDPRAIIDTAGPAIFRNTTTIALAPVNALDAANKAYVDAHAGGGSYTLPAATASALGGLQLAAGQTSTTLAKVASTGAYGDLSGLPALGGAAALSVGTTPGTVAAGNDSRLINAILSGSAASVSSLTSSGAITAASVTSNGPLSATYFSSPNNAYTLTTPPGRLNLIQNTLTVPSATSSIWENFDSFLYMNGPGIDNGEINLNHTYLENEVGSTLNGGAEGYESSQINYGQEPAGFASYLSVLTNASTGTVTNGNWFGLNTQLTNNNPAAGAIGGYAPLNCNAMLGTGSHPTYEYCIRNANPKGVIASLGDLTLGALGDNGTLFYMVTPDSSAGTFSLVFKNSSGNNLVLMDDLGDFGTYGSFSPGQWQGGNYFTLTPHAAGGAPTFASAGSDTNIGIGWVTKGTGTLSINGAAGVTCSGSPTASYAVTDGLVTHC